MDYFYFYLPPLLSWSGESEEEDLQIGGRANLFLVACFTKSDGEKNPTYLHWKALSADSGRP